MPAQVQALVPAVGPYLGEVIHVRPRYSHLGALARAESSNGRLAWRRVPDPTSQREALGSLAEAPSTRRGSPLRRRGAEGRQENLEPRPADRAEPGGGSAAVLPREDCDARAYPLGPPVPFRLPPSCPSPPGAEAIDVRLSGPSPPSAKVDPVHSLTGLGKPCLGYVTADAVTPMLMNFRRYSETFTRPAI